MRRWVLGGAAAVAVAAAIGLALPLPEAWFHRAESRRVLDRSGLRIGERALPDRGRAEWVALEDLSPWVVPALTSAEDRRFGAHPGVDPIAVGRAVWVDLRAGAALQGGSTLHQQTARLVVPRPPGLVGKAVEAVRAVRLWAHTSDRDVLELYLNRAYFGDGSHGLRAAARRTFDESPAQLSLSEVATLVGVLPAPSRLHPAVDPAAAQRARDRVLAAMVDAGAVDAATAERARAEPIELRRPPVSGAAVHFVEHVFAADPEADELRTTLDLPLQERVAALASSHVAALAGRGVSQAAVLVVHLPDREVRAWVGSVDPAGPMGQVDGVLARRSPGSALKPLLYAAAFDEGLRPSSPVLDLSGTWATTHGSWLPENYDHRHLGPVSARVALGSSLNVPAVRVLQDLGVASFQARLDAAGFRAGDRTASSLGLALSLGDLEVSPLELARAYAALATDGVVRPLRLRLDRDPAGDEVPVVSARSAAWVTDVLSDPSARVPGFGRHGALERPYPAAAKTGTSTAFRDNWTIGWTPEWIVAVWVGNFDGSPMRDVSGVTGAAPLWAAVMDDVVAGRVERFSPPPASVRREVCTLSGGAPGPSCERAWDWFPAGESPDGCTWHHLGCGVVWPPELVGWAREQGHASCVLGDVAPEAWSIAWPDAGAEVYVDPRLPIERQRLPLRAIGPDGGRFVWRVDGVDLAPGGAGEVHLWQPESAGTHRVELTVDGVVVDGRTITVRGGR